MNIILFDDPVVRKSLLPLTLTRPVSKIRIGIFTIDQKWQNHLNSSVSYLTEPYLSQKYPTTIATNNLFINGAMCPDPQLVPQILKLQNLEALRFQNLTLAFRIDHIHHPFTWDELANSLTHTCEYSNKITLITHLHNIFSHNGNEIKNDFRWISAHKQSHSIQDRHTITYNPESIFLDEGVNIRAAILNAEEGPIYIGKKAMIQEGAIIKGPFSLGEESIVNMGAKMKKDTTIGPFCKVGGEISNSVIFGYSNKAHDGFLGNSVLGEWCNLGADTNTSNLKNNYSNVKLYNYERQDYVDTGLQFCGLIMGDHSKASINTMFNTGTVVGVSSNIFRGDFPPKFVPSFNWGGDQQRNTYDFDKAMEVAEKVMLRRNVELTPIEREILQNVYHHN